MSALGVRNEQEVEVMVVSDVIREISVAATGVLTRIVTHLEYCHVFIEEDFVRGVVVVYLWQVRR